MPHRPALRRVIRFALAVVVAGALSAGDQPPVLAVSTSLPISGRLGAELAFDDKADTWFLSSRPVRDGDDLTVVLPAASDISSIEVHTGSGDGKNLLEFGDLEIAAEGANFHVAAPFVNGVAKASGIAGKTAAFRIRATGVGGQPLAISEIHITGLTPLPPVRFVTRVEAHTETARDSAKFAAKAKALCEEWYGKLYATFDTPEGPAPRSVIKLYFQTMDGVAYTTNAGEGPEIHISNAWVTKQSPNDYGMVIHELFHVVQAYTGGGEGWLTEGLADYVRHHLFEPTAPLPRIDPDKASYKDAYKTTATFLEWLEDKKTAGITLKLNAASRAKQPIPAVFKAETGAELDALWKEFTDTLRKP